MADMISVLLIALGLTFPPKPLQNGCPPGVFQYMDGASVVVDEPRENEQSYRFLDGRRGNLAAGKGDISCKDGIVLAGSEGSPESAGTPVDLLKTPISFKSAGTTLIGELLRPARSATPLPLVVMVHGSERTPAIGNRTAKLLAARGIAVFAYDKRGTGKSGGYYTQNFELLADDAAAALRAVTATDHYTRTGYYGESQGGWVAPLAATRSAADFVIVGYGLIASPIEEDKQQMLLEAERLGLNQDAKKAISKLSDGTAAVIRSNFTAGFAELDKIRNIATDQGWFERIDGEYSGEMLRMGEPDLRRIGKAVFDNLELIWNYDALGALRNVKTPILWIVAGDDREAPVTPTLSALEHLVREGKPISSYVFPNTDHGILEFSQDQNGKRSYTRFADGYFRLVADGILGTVHGSYGRAYKFH